MHDLIGTETTRTGIRETIAPVASVYDFELETVARSNTAKGDYPVMTVWPWVHAEDGSLLAGWCPICGRPHAHGVDNTGVRLSHCATAIAPYRREWVRIVIKNEPAPSDLLFAIQNAPADLLTLHAMTAPIAYTERMSGLGEARKTLRKRSRITRAAFKDVCRALLRSGIFSERLAVMVIDGGEAETKAQRHLLARFIRSRPGKTMRTRFSNAARDAYQLASRGEVAT